MVRAENLTKIYGKTLALDNVNFSVKKGEITGFLGPNGAGKSTLMNIISGYISATKGVVRVDGMDVLEEPEKTKRAIGYLPEHPPLYEEMLVDEYLDFVAHLKKVPRDEAQHEKEQLYLVLRLSDVRFRLIKNLSKGYRQRVGLAQALISSPPLLILDEPTVGLDPRQLLELRGFITSLRPKHTIIISSHILSEIQSICDQLLVIHEGRIVGNDTPQALMVQLQGGHQVTVRVRGAQQAVLQVLGQVPHLQHIKLVNCLEEGACEFVLYSDSAYDIREQIFSCLASANMPILAMARSHMSLEDVFLQLTKK